MDTSDPSKPPVFTPDEVKRFQEDINSMRRPGAYEPGKWSVSPLNRDRAVVGALPSTVRLRDVTLRALEALPGVVIDEPSRQEFLRQLVRSGVPEVVTAPIRTRSLDSARDDVETIKSLNPDCRVTCPMVFTAADLEGPAAASYDAVQIWVPPWGEASAMYEGAVHRTAWSGGNWRSVGVPRTRGQFLERAARLVGQAREKSLSVTVPLLMVSFLDEERLLETVSLLADAGANEIALFDGPGALGPEAMASLVGQSKAIAPEVQIGLHPHNSFGMAVAVAVSAAKAGADVIEVSVNGYCGGPGNADLAASVAAFEALYGISTGIDPGSLHGLAEAGERLTGYQRAYNHPITGPKVYNWGGMDFMTQELVVDELLHNCIAPSWSGSSPRIPFTEMSGPFTLWDKLVELGFHPSQALVSRLLERCHEEMSKLGRLVSDEEIATLASLEGMPRR